MLIVENGQNILKGKDIKVRFTSNLVIPECRLSQDNIPIKDIRVTEDGEILCDIEDSWLYRRKIFIQASEMMNNIYNPKPYKHVKSILNQNFI